jgi:hypothetical protein
MTNFYLTLTLSVDKSGPYKVDLSDTIDLIGGFSVALVECHLVQSTILLSTPVVCKLDLNCVTPRHVNQRYESLLRIVSMRRDAGSSIDYPLYVETVPTMFNNLQFDLRQITDDSAPNLGPDAKLHLTLHFVKTD